MKNRPEPAKHIYDITKFHPDRDNTPWTTEEPGGAAWQTWIPGLTVEQAKDVLRRDLPIGQDDITLRVAPNGFGYLLIKHESFDEDREFDLKNHTLDWGVLHVDRYKDVSYQEQGLYRRANRNEIELFRSLGVTRFNNLACDAGGGYADARLGYKPDDVNSKAFIEETAKPVQKRYAAIEPLLTGGEKKILSGAIKFAAAEDMWQVADADIDVGPRLKDLFAKAAAGDSAAQALKETIVAGVKDTYFEKNGPEILANIEERLAAGKPLTAGRFLLCGSHWYGHIDANDKPQMERVENYSGGFAAPRPS